jgi:hypothetical protein
VQIRAQFHTSIYLVTCIPELMLRDFGGRSIRLSIPPRPVHQLAPEPPPEARSARRSSQYAIRYSSSALSGPAPVPPALPHASSARPGRANLPRQRLTAHAPAWPAAARFPCRGPQQPLPRPKQSLRAGRSFAAPSLPARPASSLKRPDPRQSKQVLLACPIRSLPAWA